MFRNMAASLIRYEEIRTTLPKAKELRRVAETVNNDGKKVLVWRGGVSHSPDCGIRPAVAKLFDELGPPVSGPTWRIHPNPEMWVPRW